MYQIQFKDELLGQNCLNYEIFDARYQWTYVKNAVDKQHHHHHHLNAHQKADLLAVLKQNKKLLTSSLRMYPHHNLHIDIDPVTKPVYAHPYPCPASTFLH